jgi:hypothetical protein
MKKGIYSLPALREVVCAANRRYLEFISDIDTPTAGIDALRKISERLREGEHAYPGFNLFSAEDQVLMEALVRGEYCLRGVSNKAIRKRFPDKSSAQVSRMRKRLRIHGMIKKVGRTYHYYLTHLGRTVAIAGTKLKELVAHPAARSEPRLTPKIFLPRRREVKHIDTKCLGSGYNVGAISFLTNPCANRYTRG